MEDNKLGLVQSDRSDVTQAGDDPGMLRQGQEETWRLWQALLMGLAVSLLGFWGPLGVSIWWWLG